jgi:hypothetical protein
MLFLHGPKSDVKKKKMSIQKNMVSITVPKHYSVPFSSLITPILYIKDEKYVEFNKKTKVFLFLLFFLSVSLLVCHHNPCLRSQACIGQLANKR